MRAEPVGGGDSERGQLAFVDNAVDTTTGTILLKGTLPQHRRRALARRVRQRPAAAVRRRDALVVPATAVVTGQQGSFVFVVGAGQHGGHQAGEAGPDRGRRGHRERRAPAAASGW